MSYQIQPAWVLEKYPEARSLLNLRGCHAYAVCSGSVRDITVRIQYHLGVIRMRKGFFCFLDTDRRTARGLMEQVPPDLLKWVFSVEELMFDPTRNVMVPPHRLVSSPPNLLSTRGQRSLRTEKSGEVPQEEEKRKRDLEVEDISRLPILLPSDVIARWYGFSLGSVIAIDRDDGTYLRIVSSD